MERLNLSRWLKIITIGVGFCGLLIYFFIIPSAAKEWALGSARYSYNFCSWIIFLWIAGIPCFIALIDFWKICCEIGRDNSFSIKNAVFLKQISYLAFIDSAFFFAGNFVFLFLGISNIGILLKSLLVAFAGIAIAIASATLSHLVGKAAKLQSENDLTI